MIQQILLAITFVYGPLYLLTHTKIFTKHISLPFSSLGIDNKNSNALSDLCVLLDIIFFYFSLCYQSYYWLFKTLH